MPGPSNTKRKKKSSAKAKNKSKRGEHDGIAAGSGKPTVLRGRLSPEPSKQHSQVPATSSISSRYAFTGHQIHPSLSSLDAISSHRQQRLLDEHLPSNANLGISEDSSSDSYPPSPLLTPEPPTIIDLLDPSCPESLYDAYIRKNPSTERIVPHERLVEIEQVLQKPSFIHDPGNGPRVRNIREFLKSEFFAQPPSHEVSFYTPLADDDGG